MVPGDVNPWPGYEGRQTRNEVDRFEGYLRRPVAVGCLAGRSILGYPEHQLSDKKFHVCIFDPKLKG